MRLKSWLYGSLIAVTTFANIHANADANTDEQQLFDRLAQYKSFEAKFAQTVQDKEGNTIDQASGSFVMAQPNRLYWQQEAELEQLVVTNGDTLWLYDPDFEQVTIRTLTPESTAMPSVLFSGDEALIRASFEITSTAVGDQVAESYVLIPKGENPQFQKLEVGFNHKRLSHLTIYDFLGQITQIEVRQPKMLEHVADSLFSFTPPEGTEIIDDRD